MPNPFGFSYAAGDLEIRHAAAGSNFSRGDLVMFTTGSASSLSRADELYPSGMKIAGVALSASTASYQYGSEDNGAALVAYAVWKPETLFWGSFVTSEAQAGSVHTAGEEFDVRYYNNRFSIESSQNSTRVTIVDARHIGVESARSYVIVRPIVSGGEAEL